VIKVVIIEDNLNIREGLKLLINGTGGYQCTASFESCEELFEQYEKIEADIFLMDIELPGMNGIEGIKKLKQLNPESIVLVITVYEDNEVLFDALCAGASGYLVKNTPPSRLLDAIKEAAEGGSPMSSNIARKVINYFRQNKVVPEKKSESNLSEREKEVLKCLMEGYSHKAIADTLFISLETVRFHFRNIYKKLHVHSQTEAIAKAIKEKLI